jgi:hypothetical protein
MPQQTRDRRRIHVQQAGQLRSDRLEGRRLPDQRRIRVDRRGPHGHRKDGAIAADDLTADRRNRLRGHALLLAHVAVARRLNSLQLHEPAEH